MSETNETPSWMKWQPTTPVEQVPTPEPKVATFVKEKLYIGNSSTTPRGLMLKRGVVILQPYEVREVPENIEDEIRSLFKTRAVQALVDCGYLQIGNSPIIQVKAQPTPKPPTEIGGAVPVPSGSGAAIAGSSTQQIGGTAALKLDSTVITEVK